MSLLSLIFPSVCLHCKKPLAQKIIQDVITSEQQFYSDVMAPYLCHTCIQDFNPGNNLRCCRCGESIYKKDAGKNSCQACFHFKQTFENVSFAGLYQGSYKQLIHLYKFKNKRQLARPFAQLLKNKFEKTWCIHQIDRIAPVPLHISRLRERGFNQALLMLWQWKEKPFQSKIVPQLLIRVRPTHSQTLLPRKERMKNLRSAFQLNNKYSVAGQRIVLVDDVYTTGATAFSCAQVLKENGAAGVYILTLARA